MRTLAPLGGQVIETTAVLVKYSYHGDADFNGKLDFDDYALIDLAFNTQGAGCDLCFHQSEGKTSKGGGVVVR